MTTLAQRRKNRAKWLRDLRSGAFRQTRACLKNPYDGGLCCLGVLCVTYAKAHKIINPWVKGDNGYMGFKARDGINYETVPPKEVLEWVGLVNDNGGYENKKGVKNFLTDLNDSKEMSFKQIANVIETEPAGMFEEKPFVKNTDYSDD